MTEDHLHLPGASKDHDAESVSDLSSVTIPKECPETQPSKCAPDRRGSSSHHAIAEVGRTRTDRSSATTNMRDVRIEDLKSVVGVHWQWEHRTGYRDYTWLQDEKIEAAYRRGQSKVRVQSGKVGVTPMEIFFIDMVQYDPVTDKIRKVKRKGPRSCGFRLKRLFMEAYHSWYTGFPYRETFEQFQLRRSAISRENSSGRISHSSTAKSWISSREKVEYNPQVWCGKIARDPLFFSITMLVVLANAVWMAYDADCNVSSQFYNVNAGLQFIIAENLFCTFFAGELLIRFLGFLSKRKGMKDFWFRFDLFLVILMGIEVWLIPLILVLAGDDMNRAFGSNFSMLRMARMLRLSRIPRLLRALPEVITLVKGIIAALRSVFFTLLLLVIILYVFGIIFRSQSEGYDDLRATYFRSVGDSMMTLLVHGTFLDNVSDFVTDLRTAGASFLTWLYLLVVFLTSFTILNMLIGIVCEVISIVKNTEEGEAEQQYLHNNLFEIFECYDKNGNNQIERAEFQLLMANPEVIDAIRCFGVDPNGLKSVADVFFDENDGQLGFEEIMNLVIRLRGNHSSKVTDIIEFRQYMKSRLEHMEAYVLAGHKALEQKLEEAFLPKPVAQDSVLVQFEMFGERRERRQASSTTVGEFLGQLVGLQAKDNVAAICSNGVELGTEVKLGTLSNTEGIVFLELRPLSVFER